MHNIDRYALNRVNVWIKRNYELSTLIMLSFYQSNRYRFSRALTGSCSSRYPRILVDFAAEVKMVSRFPTVSDEGIFALTKKKYQQIQIDQQNLASPFLLVKTKYFSLRISIKSTRVLFKSPDTAINRPYAW